MKWRKLFGGRGTQQNKGQANAEVAASEQYKSFEIRAAPIRESGVWRIAGAVVAVDSTAADEQTFVRADTCASHDDAVALSLRKARQIVDEMAMQAGR